MLNKVELLECMGDDSMIVRAARVSYGMETKGEEADRKLIKYLLDHGHMSPFEQPQIQYRIKAPIFVLRQLMRHRAGHWNEISARYTTVKNEFYVPEEWRKQDTKNKQSSDGLVGVYLNNVATDTYTRAIDHCVEAYNWLLRAGIAREQARMVLPVSAYSEVIVTFDLRNLLNLFDQRIHEGAQWETQQVAMAMKELIVDKFKWVFEYYRPS